MIDKNASNELKAWINSRSGTYSSVAEWTIRTAADPADKSHPLVIVEPTGAEEHEVLRGVMDPLTIEVRLETVPHASGSSAGATDLSTHEGYVDDLYNILADRDAVDWIDLRGTIRCFDIRGSEPTLEEEDGRRVSVVEVRMVCCNA